MSRSKRVLTRRQVLRGAGGFTLGLPFLPSLLPGPAYGQDPTMMRQKRFFGMDTRHGLVAPDVMYPTPARTETHMLYPGHQISRGELPRTVSGTTATVSGLLQAPADVLTPELVSKMNVYRGIDIPFYISHHEGGALGNYGSSAGNGGGGRAIRGQHTPTVDHLIAWQPGFHRDPSTIRMRQVQTGNAYGLSWGYSSPSEDPALRGGGVREEANVFWPQVLFARLFTGFTPPGDMPDPRTPVVDRVLESYRTLRESNRRLSRRDRQRLDEHIQHLADVQRRLNTRVSASCEVPAAPAGGNPEPRERLRQTIDILGAALRCGVTNVAVLGVPEQLEVPGVNDWHNNVAHESGSNEADHRAVQAVHRFGFELMARLAQALDVEDAPGETILDNSLLYWMQENGGHLPPGFDGHGTTSVATVTFGSAGGFFNTGYFYDFRNMTRMGLGEYNGIFHNQFLANILLSMGVPRSTWQNVQYVGPTGYAHLQVRDGHEGGYVPQVEANASEPIDWLTRP
ncbi:MAG: DUF1552 domain-containing protein [Myxococcota bacterium]